MKVYIGPYHHWFQPFRWLKKALHWWYGCDGENIDIERYDAVNSMASRWFDWLNDLEQWVDGWYTRKIKVRVDYYDTWDVDATLTPVILPLLKQLKATKQGSPHVDDADVPDELKSTSAPPLSEEDTYMGRTDANWHKRWDWVMDEMIWAFEQMDPDADSKFFEHSDDKDFATSIRNMKFDKEGYNAWHERKTRGLTFFGKYFEALWD